MDWMDGLLLIVSAAVAYGLAVLLVRRRGERRLLFGAALVGLFVLAVSVGQAFLLEPWRERHAAGQLHEQLETNPAFAALKKHEPAAYASVVESGQAAMRSGHSLAQAQARMRAELMPLVEQRLHKASDEALTRYMSVSMQEVRELMAQPDDMCYRMLFPQGGPPPDVSSRLSPQTLQSDLQALGQVITSAAQAPQPVPPAAEMEARLKPLYDQVFTKHGVDAELLRQPQAELEKQRQACQLVLDLYSAILQRPQAEAGPMLRYMLAPQ